MERRTILLVAVLFVLLIVGMFVFAHLNKTEQGVDVVKNDNDLVADPYAYITRIDVKQFIGAGTQTLVGVLELPTPCDLLTSEVRVLESLPERIEIDLSVNNTSDMCATVVTPQRFVKEVSASDTASVSVSLNGRPLEVNLIPAAPGELPGEAAVDYKG